MACSSCGGNTNRSKPNRHAPKSKNSELEYLNRYTYLKPNQIRRKRELEEQEKKNNSG